MEKNILKLEYLYKKIVYIFLSIFTISLLLSELVAFAIPLVVVKIAALPIGIMLIVWKYRLKNINGSKFKDGQSPATFALTLFMLINLISIFLNYRSKFFVNLFNLSYMAIFIYLGFDAYADEDISDRKKMLNSLAKYIVIINFVMTIVSLLTFCFAIGYRHEAGYVIGLDTYTNRLWGLFNPNAGSTISLISIALSLYLINNNSNKGKSFNILNIIMQSIYMILAQSRATLVGAAIFLFIILTFAIYNKSMTNLSKSYAKDIKLSSQLLNRIKIEKFITASAFALVMVSVVGFTIRPAQTILAKIPEQSAKYMSELNIEVKGNNEVSKFINNMFIAAPDEKEFKIEIHRSKGSKIENQERGRSMYWRKTLEGLNESPVVGLSYEGLIKEVQKSAPDKVVSNQIRYGGVHSSFFSILGASGILGILAFLAFFIFMNLEIINYIFNELKYSHKVDMNFIIIYALVSMVYLIDLMESRLFYSINYYAILIWFLNGGLYTRAANAEYSNVEEATAISRLFSGSD